MILSVVTSENRGILSGGQSLDAGRPITASTLSSPRGYWNGVCNITPPASSPAKQKRGPVVSRDPACFWKVPRSLLNFHSMHQ